MSLVRDATSLREMLDLSREAAGLARSRTEPDFRSDRVFQLALVHLLQTIGEAARRVAQPIRDGIPDVRWREITGMRGWIIHSYDAVDLALGRYNRSTSSHRSPGALPAVTHGIDQLIIDSQYPAPATPWKVGTG